MAEQLKAATAGRTAPWLIGDDLRAVLRRPHFVVLSVVIIAAPPVSGVVSLPGYAFDHWMSYFTVMVDWVALTFPLLVTLLTQPRLLDEWSNTYAALTRPRVSAADYFRARVLVSGVLAAAVFFAMTVVCFVVARLTFTDHGYGTALVAPIEGRFPLSQIWGIQPILYPVVFSAWVAVVAGTVGAWCTLVTAVVSNKFVALAAPFVLWLAADFALAVLGQEELSLPPFRFHIKQQPVWTEFVGWAAIAVVTVGLWAFVRRRDYRSAGIVRT